MISALIKGFAQLRDPVFRRVFGLSVFAAIVLFGALWVLAWFGLSWAGDALAAWGRTPDPGSFWSWVGELIFKTAAFAGLLVVSFLLFPTVMVLVMSLLLDAVAAAVEQRHYPNLPAPRDQPLGEGLGIALGFTGASLALNILALPLYLVPLFNVFVFYLLNGYLLGREYFELVAARRLDRDKAGRMRRGHFWRILLAGMVIAILLTVPLVNLITPLVATGFMLHLFEDLRSGSGSAT